MIENTIQVNRKKVEEDRIAICPKFGCKHLEKVKPLKFGVFGFRKYPKCSKHKLSLVFVDEFIENFIQAINACLFDISGLPPESLLKLLKEKASDDVKTFIKGWIYCNPIGRGTQIVSVYMDGLSRSYIKLLNRKQRKSLQDEITSKKRHHMLRSGLNKIAEEYTDFLQNLREKSELINQQECYKLSKHVRNLLNGWLKSQLDDIHISKKGSDWFLQNNPLSSVKSEYDKILCLGTCMLLLGKSPTIITKGLSAFELFSAYKNFLEAGLCKEIKKDDVEVLLAKSNTPYNKKSKISKFDEEYKKKMLKFIEVIYKSIALSDKVTIEDLILNVERIFNDACENGLTLKIVHNQDLRYPEKLAIILAYYSLLLIGVDHIEETYLKPALIYNKVKNSLAKRGISPKAKRPSLLSGFLYDFLYSHDQEKLNQNPFFKNRNKNSIPFKENIQKELEELIKNHKNLANLDKITNLIMEDLFRNNFKRINIPSTCRNPKNLTRVILFLALRHNKYRGSEYYSKAKDFLNFYSDTDLSNVCFYEVIRIAYQFLSAGLKREINYLPQDLNLADLTVLETHLLKIFSEIANSLNLKATDKLKAIASNLIRDTIQKGFSFQDLPSNHIPSLALAFLFLTLQISEDHNNLSRRLMIINLNKVGYSFSEHSLGPILQYIGNFINEDVDFNFKAKIDSDYFQNELTKISLKHESFGRNCASNFVNLILDLYKLSYFEPQEFARKLGIYSGDPSLILIRIGESRILTRVDIFFEMEKKISDFIKTYISDKNSRRLQIQLSEIVDYFKSSKKVSKHQSYLKVNKRRALYGNNYKSTIVRLKRFIIMLGFSSYDGYDFIENKYIDIHNKTRLNAHFHHLDYDSKNDAEENLIFLPSKHPRDRKKKIEYMTHDKISGMEAICKDERTSISVKEKTQKKLADIKKRMKINAKIVSQVFFSHNMELLDELIGWSQQSIMKIKNRLEDNTLNWTAGLNDIIPKEKYGKKVSKLEFNNLKKKKLKLPK